MGDEGGEGRGVGEGREGRGRGGRVGRRGRGKGIGRPRWGGRGRRGLWGGDVYCRGWMENFCDDTRTITMTNIMRCLEACWIL